MNLLQALRLDKKNKNGVISFIGSGGKTTAMFQLAKQIYELRITSYVFLTCTTHLGTWQTKLADRHIAVKDRKDLQGSPNEGIVLLTGALDGERTKPIDESVLTWLYEYSNKQNIPLLIEADGSRQKPLKAPAEHEPPIPEFTDTIIYVVGLNAIGKPLNDEHVHRPEIFSQLTNLEINESITSESIIKALTHSQGGLKNIPRHAKKIALLNQADTPELKSIGGSIAKQLLNHFDSVLVGSLHQDNFQTFEKTAGVILAAGDSTRFGSPKQLLDWKGKPFIRHIAETALQAGLEPVLVITGIHHADIESCLTDLPVTVIYNPNYKNGQSESIKLGIKNLAPSVLSDTSPKSTTEVLENSENQFSGFGGGRVGVGSCVFLLADQPQIPVEVIRALKEKHSQTLSPIIAPLVLEERRANPVLFDKVTFPDLLQLTGDVGGRAIFDKHKVDYLPWHDDILIFDVDTKEDYERLKGFES
ncbi:MAG: putative selenium-dependent hydroxylase accessory protein YqeC [Anaerolineales bacterium]|nr:putative selenium-dependent hydroxylase accessory protein YqeC [Anaerolineales bacterium]